MFADAYQKAICFTRPVIIFCRFFNKTVECGPGTFVVLNEEGWIISVAHLLSSYFAYREHAQEISNYEGQLKAIQQNPTLNAKQKRKKVNRLKSNPKWVTNHAFWWGGDGVQLKDMKVLREGDLFVGRLDPFDSKTVDVYPVLKDPSTLSIGRSLCRLGYPFHEIRASFDEENHKFILAPDALPLPRFPIEGIYTRNAVAGKSNDGKYEIKFLETSSPGLKGQSGGPIFDVKGTVWAIQSRTVHYALGFSPKIKMNKREVEEHQFLNVGMGVHPELIVSFLKDNGIKFTLSDY